MDTAINLYKPLGWTPLQALEAFRASHPGYRNLPLTYAGRLDPMAEGVLLVLAGDEAKHREPYMGLDKTYEAEILFGVATDTLDTLGLVTACEPLSVHEHGLCDAVASLVGKPVLPVPAYASVPVGGKPLFQWAREGRLEEIELPRREMEIFSAELLGMRQVPAGELCSSIIKNIAKVSGDFRQREIAAVWRQSLEGKRQSFWVATVRVSCGSGTYVRSLAQYLGDAVGVPAMLLSLVRTRVGQFDIKDAVRLAGQEKQ